MLALDQPILLASREHCNLKVFAWVGATLGVCAVETVIVAFDPDRAYSRAASISSRRKEDADELILAWVRGLAQ